MRFSYDPKPFLDYGHANMPSMGGMQSRDYMADMLKGVSGAKDMKTFGDVADKSWNVLSHGSQYAPPIEGFNGPFLPDQFETGTGSVPYLGIAKSGYDLTQGNYQDAAKSLARAGAAYGTGGLSELLMTPLSFMGIW